MSPDLKAGQDRDDFDYDAPRSIFAATWFRVLLVLIVVGVAGAIAVPYALDWMNASTTSTTPAVVQSAPLPAPPAQTAGEASAPAGAAVAGTPPSDTAAPPPPAGVTPPSETASAAPPAAAMAPTTLEPPKAQAEPKNSEAMKSEPSRTDAAPARAAARPTPKPRAKAARVVAQAAASGGTWWVQVGAFKDAQTAQRVAEKLRAANFDVQESTVTQAGAAARPASPAPGSSGIGEQYDVFVTGMPTPELTGRLTTKGLASEASGSGVVVRPSLPLRDAVALSKDLAAEGLKVHVRRAGGDAGGSPSAAPAMSQGGETTLHRVRVGGFGDRAAASAAMRELEAKGFKGFLTRQGS